MEISHAAPSQSPNAIIIYGPTDFILLTHYKVTQQRLAAMRQPNERVKFKCDRDIEE